MYKRMHTRTRRLDITPRVKEEVWERDGGRCILCGTSEAAPNAHYIARSYLMSQYDDWEEDALVYRKLPYLPQAGQGD